MKFLHSAVDRALDQIERLGGVVEVIAEGIDDRFGTTIFAAKCAMASTSCSWMSRATNSASPKSPITSFAFFRNRPGEAGRQIVEHDHLLAGVE